MEEKNTELLEESTDTAQPELEESNTAKEQIVPADDGAPEAEAAPRVDYADLVRRDVDALRREFPELAALSSVTELDNPLRYAALRDLGLSAREAYLATSERPSRTDNRAHLYSTPTRARGGGSMPEAELSCARAIFGDLSDSEIRKLYKKVTV
ncbi:MAG: hypothetical protein J6V09_03265 [Clostridia bacterium]|nr:hypothetical protein [Clostridia bacterium]